METRNRVFNIPIEDYERYMNTELSRDKKEEITELLINHCQIRSQAEFDEVKHKLHEAIEKGDLDLIKIYLSETIENKSNELTFKINKTNKTASLFSINNKEIEHLIVPRTVKHGTEEYLITSICWIGYSIFDEINIKTLKFEENSSVSTIYSNAFSYSQIEEIYFPNSLKVLKEEWCGFTKNLKKIFFSQSNDQLTFKENKYLFGKTDNQSEEFDVLLFVNRDIKKISIPTNIKRISSFSFSYSKIEKIFIPPNVSKICKGAFFYCIYIQKVEIPTNSNLQTIEKFAFSYSNIKEIFIPSNVSKIYEYAFYSCKNLQKVEIAPNSNLQTIEKFTFSSSNIENFFIPPNISKICKNAFNDCKNLQIVEIPEDSKLQSLSPLIFDNCPKVIIMIPSSLKIDFSID